MTSPNKAGGSDIIRELLHRGLSPDVADSIQNDIRHRPLLLRPTTIEDQPQDAREARRRQRENKAAAQARRKRKPAVLNAKQKRALGIYDIPEEQRKWDIFWPLHQLWLGYIRDVLGVQRSDGSVQTVTKDYAGSTLTNADLHGAMLEVVRCRSVGRVGIKGIVAKETKGTFEIITKNNQLKGMIRKFVEIRKLIVIAVPKEFTTFRLEIPLEHEDNLVFEILGDQFVARPAERATKKFKIKIPKDT
jgi:ribonuclease P protein subunit POP4